MKCVIAEDDENSRFLLETLLKAHGHSVVARADGAQALAAIRSDPPDVVISDILMPQMDGFDLCRILRNDDRFRHTPFIFYTATYTDSRDERLGLALGANRFLFKPMEISKLLKEIELVVAEPPAQPSRHPDDSNSPTPGELTELRVDSLTRKLNKKVHELEQALATLRASEERFRQLAENIRECFWITSADGNQLVYASPVFEEIWGYSSEHRAARPESWIESISCEDRDRLQRTFFERARAGSVEEKYRIIRPDGSVRWLRDRGFAVTDDIGTVYRIAGITEDITEEQELSEKLIQHANYDALTKLANRRVFEQRLQRVLEDARRDRTEHALLYLDLDQFKVVNDTCGHISGDELLCQISTVLRGQVRKRDTLARLGGDEFGVLLEHCSPAQAERVAASLRKAVEKFRFVWEGSSFNIGVSIGLVSIDVASENITNVLKAADSACYVAKEQGGNRVHIGREGDTELARRHGEMVWVGRLHSALEQGRFQLHCQAIAPTRSTTLDVEHHEILLRLVDDEGNLVLPGQFLPSAERYKLGNKIDRWVIRSALLWLKEHPDLMSLCSINVSGSSLADKEFFDFIVAQMGEIGIQPSKICFEITETAAISNLATASDLMRVLKQKGCKFALDDFGAGLSSFAYLKNLPVDYLKIDGAFVRDIVDDPLDFAMVKSINDIGHVMGKQTIAEFVENDAILDKLRHIGVDYVQGHAVGYPQPCDALAAVSG